MSTSDADPLKKAAQAVGKAMQDKLVPGNVSSASGGIGPFSAEDLLRNERMARDNLDYGAYFTLRPEHAANYAEIEKRVGFIRSMLPKAAKDIPASVVVNLYDTGDSPQTHLLMTRSMMFVVVNEALVQKTGQYTDELIRQQRSYGYYQELSAEDIGNFLEFRALVANKGYKRLPRIILDKEAPAYPPKLVVLETSRGVPIVRINASAHEMTPHYARQLQITDRHIASEVTGGTLIAAEGAGVSHELLAAMKASSASRNLTSPAVYLDTRYNGVINVDTTQEGTHVIRVSENFLRWPLSTQKAMVEHELAHIQNGDTSPEGRAKYHNIWRRTGNTLHSVEKEKAADFMSVCGSPHPLATAYSLAAYFRDGRGDGGGTHPPDKDRHLDMHINADLCGFKPLDTPKPDVVSESRKK